MKTSDAGKALIKSFESCSLTPYRCPAGIPTIGWGTTRYPDGKVVSMQDARITTERADFIFTHDLGKFESTVSNLVHVDIQQREFDALVSFAYNLGGGALEKSTLLRKLNAGDHTGAADEFLKWDKAGGVALAGLARRRKAERAMFLGVKA